MAKSRKTVEMLETRLQECIEELEYTTDEDEHKKLCSKIERLEKILSTEKNFENHVKFRAEKIIDIVLKGATVAVPVLCTMIVVGAEMNDGIIRSKALPWVKMPKA